MAYLYRHIRLDKNQPFYIGIGNDENYKRSKIKANRSNFWKKIIAKTEYRVEILIDNLTWEEACQKEIEFILLYGRKDLSTGTLVNMTNGGEGTPGIKRSQEYISKLSERQKGEKSCMFGKKHSEETITKMSEIKKGKLPSKETKEKLRLASTGCKNAWYGKHTAVSKKVIDIETNIVYESIADCQINTKYKKLYEKLSGKRKNNTPIRHYS
jgi:hypothetical protein